MSRWHKLSCREPDIVVQGGTPRCQACHSSPDIDGLIEQQKFTSPFSKPPDDEPLGQLNLYWPSSVPYISASALSPAKDTSNKPNEPAQQDPIISPFRLLYLSASINGHDPIHAEFDTYKLDRCPEYEATSYTWAGENGDSSLCEPIFLGPYWDILLQTQNCWSMLQSMRPRDKGFRVVWVDAICINQNDVEERDAQVSRMSQIYSGCRRVFVYLGPDVTTPTSDRHPLRRQLQLFTGQIAGQRSSNDSVDLLGLLQRRYFSRVWVIQELLLSRQAVIQIGDVEFWIDPSAMTSLSSNLRWEDTAAPWFEHLGQQRFQDKDLYQILRATRGSRCFDIRDKVFGMLALFGKDSSPQAFQANYRLSCQHVFVGVFSHILLNLKHASVLLHAPGRRAWGRHPSWVPNWNASGSEWIFRYPTEDAMQVITAWKDKQDDRADTRLFHVSAESKRWTTQQELNSDSQWLAWYALGDRSDDDPNFITKDLKKKHVVSFERIWHRDATVDAVTGTLSINLIHLLRFRSTPRMVSRSGGLSLFLVQGKSATMCLISNARLDKYVMPGRDHLFILDTGQSSCFYIVMRKLDATDTFRILACCNHLAFKVPSESLRTPWQDSAIKKRSEELKRRGVVSYGSLQEVVYPPEIRLFLIDLHNSLFQSLQTFDLSGSIWFDENRLSKMFLGVKHQEALREKVTVKDYYPTERVASQSLMRIGIMPAFQGLLNETTGSTPGFLDSYVNCLPESMCAEVRDDHVVITVEPHGWDPHNSIYEEWRDDATGPTMIQLRASKSDLQRTISDTLTFECLSELTPAARLTMETEIEMARRGLSGPDWPKREDHFVLWSRWPKVIMDCFDIDGSTQRVNIA
ncbi:hypothetical protein LCI18_014474 [Fusarium solani-melongenae]|uniref:Uncharacterized protein n=1 Tax=Fusarium solani subsp. cucurbitae TaxID=2747967 RepID=A0ACD3ZQB3_FUSSC|nr:hypothetical protein LCI18_014474 [Fusarium solani-melongenae]